MEEFKKALKQAILDKAEAVRFEEGLRPCIMLFSAEKPLGQLNISSGSEVKALIEGLINTGTAIGDNFREGVLSIVNFGELKLLAQVSNPAKLYAFIPPQGNALYQQVRNQLLSPIKDEGVQPIPFLPDEASISKMEYQRPEQKSVPPTADFASLQDSMPPFVKRDAIEQQTQVSGKPPRPEFAPIPSEVSLIGSLNEGSNSIALPLPDGLSTSIESPEYEGENDDYHYLKKTMPPNASTSMHTAVAPAPAAQPAAILSPASDGEVRIHFGAHVPGETIERKERFAIDSILQDMIRRKASDLHLTLGEAMCLRIDGDIVRIGSDPVNESMMRELLLPIMPMKNRQEFAKTNDSDFAYEIPGVARFRVNTFRDRMGVGAVLRQIPDKVLSADDLGLSAAVRKFCELQKGLVIVTGPTGSGKSTTLAGMVDLINDTRSDHIITIEDPIEFVHRQKKCLINQREVHKHTQSFARALRAALREDPDIILIGEMRDLETVGIAIETAETGHLVFGTLHTNTAISTVDRLIDQFPADQQEQIRVMLAESLRGVVAQTLVKKKGGGRCAAQEILVVDKAVSSLIREGNTHMVQNHMQTQKAKGNITLNDALMNLVQKGLVEAKDAYAKSVEKEAFAAMLQKAGISFDGLKSAS